MIAFDNRHGPARLQLGLEMSQCLLGRSEMLQYKTDKYVIKAFVGEWGVVNISLEKRPTTVPFLGNPFFCNGE